MPSTGGNFTPTGRATGEWSDAIAALRDAEDEVQRCAAAVAEVDDRVNRHAALTAELAELSPLQQAAAVRRTAAQAAADKIAQLTEQLKEAGLIAAAAAATSAASTSAHTERVRLRAETDTRAATVAASKPKRERPRRRRRRRAKSPSRPMPWSRRLARSWPLPSSEPRRPARGRRSGPP